MSRVRHLYASYRHFGEGFWSSLLLALTHDRTLKRRVRRG